jgi:hypothetical protein
MASTGWKRPFDDPIPLSRGRELVALEDAAKYIQKLSKAEQQFAEWQAAVEALLLVVEHNGPTMMARIGLMRALNGNVVREFDSDRKDAQVLCNHFHGPSEQYCTLSKTSQLQIQIKPLGVKTGRHPAPGRGEVRCDSTRFCYPLGTHSPLRLILGPCLFAALALEHADRAPIAGIEHSPNQGGLFVALIASSDGIGIEAGKDLVFELVIHESRSRFENAFISYKVNKRS